MQLALALVITLVSACALNVGYLIEHSVASKLPPLQIRHPIRSTRLLLSSRRWLAGFGIEAIGWLLYVLALALAPLSLVQATAAGGIGILAIMVSRVTGVRLSRRERIGVVLSVGGLVLLGISLLGAQDEGTGGSTVTIVIWLIISAAAAFLAARFGHKLVRSGAAFGLATGILFAAGDVATKALTSGGVSRLPFIVALIAAYACGTGVLQAGFQRGGALTTAGIATLLTNALPIVAGMTIFGESLPRDWLGALRIASFAAVVAGAVGLARGQEPVPEADTTPEPAAARA
jgi:drug/metabolite transporter (DMT)-like permease